MAEQSKKVVSTTKQQAVKIAAVKPQIMWIKRRLNKALHDKAIAAKDSTATKPVVNDEAKKAEGHAKSIRATVNNYVTQMKKQYPDMPKAHVDRVKEQLDVHTKRYLI